MRSGLVAQRRAAYRRIESIKSWAVPNYDRVAFSLDWGFTAPSSGTSATCLQATKHRRVISACQANTPAIAKDACHRATLGTSTTG